MKQLTNEVLPIDRNARTGGCPRRGPSSVACELCDGPLSSASPVLSNHRERSVPSSPLCSCCETALGRHPEPPPVLSRPPASVSALITTPGTTSTGAAQLRVSQRTQEPLGGREGELPTPRTCRVAQPGAEQTWQAPDSLPWSTPGPRAHLHPAGTRFPPTSAAGLSARASVTRANLAPQPAPRPDAAARSRTRPPREVLA